MSDTQEEKQQKIADEIAALAEMPYADLRSSWRRLHRAHPPKFLSRNLLEMGVAWKLQERAFGGHSAATKRHLNELAQTLETKSDLAKARRVRLRPGARLVREWRGETHEVLVTEDGFLWRGENWQSLSVIAREMTGTVFCWPEQFTPSLIARTIAPCGHAAKILSVAPAVVSLQLRSVRMAAVGGAVAKNFAVPSTHENRRMKGWNRTSILLMHSASLVRHSFLARRVMAGSRCQRCTTMAGFPAAPWNARP